MPTIALSLISIASFIVCQKICRRVSVRGSPVADPLLCLVIFFFGSSVITCAYTVSQLATHPGWYYGLIMVGIAINAFAGTFFLMTVLNLAVKR